MTLDRCPRCNAYIEKAAYVHSDITKCIDELLERLSWFWVDTIADADDVPDDSFFERWKNLSRPLVSQYTAKLTQPLDPTNHDPKNI